jgi:glycine cleavage system H protein
MNIPQDLKYTRDHEWIKVEGNSATIGITDFAQHELGDIVYVEIEVEGEYLERGDVFGTIEAVKTVSDLFMPVSGDVVEVNALLQSKAEIVNSDPYGDGWMIKINIKDASELSKLLTVDQYKALIAP